MKASDLSESQKHSELIIRLVLSKDKALEGTAVAEEGDEFRFSGWLELMAAIDRIRSLKFH